MPSLEEGRLGTAPDIRHLKRYEIRPRIGGPTASIVLWTNTSTHSNDSRFLPWGFKNRRQSHTFIPDDLHLHIGPPGVAGVMPELAPGNG